MKLKALQVKTGIERWRKILHIESNWKIHYQIRENSSEMSEGHADSLACIDVDLRYFEAVVEFNVPEIEVHDYDLDVIILHELLHIIIAPLASSSACGLGKKFEEINTILSESTIERLMPGYLYLYNKKEARKKPTK